ncbi:MAG: hypothetical protein JSV86_01225 [Gemmatimonadota bacterium]|nr:MAG: hypothetical protein JSV86_01225 [Gemmatimonadota bacterium]
MRDFTHVVRENVGEYRGIFCKFVRWAPIFVATLMVLSQDPRLQTRHRSWVNAALAYYVGPDDAMPVDEFGPAGYLDDNLVSAYVLERIARDVGWRVIEDAWTGEETAHDVALETLDRERELLGDLGEEALQRAGVLDEARRRLLGDQLRPYGLA